MYVLQKAHNVKEMLMTAAADEPSVRHAVNLLTRLLVDRDATDDEYRGVLSGGAREVDTLVCKLRDEQLRCLETHLRRQRESDDSRSRRCTAG